MKVVKRPWGLFKRFVINQKCTVKLLELRPKQEISLQKHKKRSEIWYFLDEGIVRIGNKKKKVKQGELVKVPKCKKHKIFAGNKKLRILEISLGEFDERDEIRLEDKYGRS
jgi:mannose-6-phosphate isomerase